MSKTNREYSVLYVENLERAKSFYQSVFRIKLERFNNTGEEWLFPLSLTSFSLPNKHVKLSKKLVTAEEVIIYFTCIDILLKQNLIKEFGGRIEKSIFSIGPYGSICLASDPEGNLFGIHSLISVE